MATEVIPLLDELDGQVINYGMSMLTHHRSYMYSVQDILNNEEDITSFYFYGDSQTEITPDSYTTSWEKSIGKVAERYGSRQNVITKMKFWS